MASFAFGVDPGPLIFDFTNTTQVTIDHNLGYKPFVYVVTSEGLMSFATITYTDDNQIVISFQNSQTGKAYIR